METKVVEKKEFELPNRKVTIRLVDRPRGAIKDPKHILYNMCPTATYKICPRNKRGSSEIDCPLTFEEIKFFENKSKSGMAFSEGDLSPFRDDSVNYWRSKKATVTLNDKPITLNLNKPGDYLKYTILKSNSDVVAPSLKDEFKKRTYVFVMISEDEVQEKAISKADKQKRAWKIAGKIEDSSEKMINFLTIIGKRPSANSKMDYLRAEVAKQIDTNIDRFLEIMEDPQYDTRLLLIRAVQRKAVKRETTKYFLMDGTPLVSTGEINNIKNVLNFLDAPENQDVRLLLIAKTEDKK